MVMLNSFIKHSCLLGGGLALVNVLAFYSYNGTLSRVEKCLKNLPEILLVTACLYFLWKLVRGTASRIIAGILTTAIVAVYLFQFFYYAVNGENVSILALENVDQVYLFLQMPYILVLLAMAAYCAFAVYISAKLGQKAAVATKKRYIFLYTLILGLTVVYQNISASILNPALSRYFSHGHESPLVSFVSNVYSVFLEDELILNGKSYAFQKNSVYEKPLPFAAINKTDKRPNVILILTEGTSARLLGCYNNRYVGLTPHIDGFAAQAMQVKNYYNHTAATFRGTLGQLASCYPQRGGAAKAEGWGNKSLTNMNYQALPKILDKEYDTYFFSPHAADDSYTILLQIAGFQNIITSEKISTAFVGKTDLAYKSIKDRDMYKALASFVDNRDSDRPFFLAMYTVGTHAGFDVAKDGVVYGDAKNPVLNTVHNLDASFGDFWQKFLQSPYKDNTIVIFTADHAHYFEKPYVQLVGKDLGYKPYFVDAVPLIIYDPIHALPHSFDACDDTSLALAPTILHLLDYKDVKNSFMGKSLFDEGERIHTHAEGNRFMYIYQHVAYDEKSIPENCIQDFVADKKKILQFYSNEKANKIIKIDGND